MTDDRTPGPAIPPQLRELIATTADGVTAILSGTDQTVTAAAAAAVADSLGRDLVRVDLRELISPYAGETEQNLRRVFDAAEAGGAVLLFDEADALFGKRSEIRDSHDRYADVDLAAVRQRLESYRGVVLVRTSRDDLDDEVRRRQTTVVRFPKG